MLGTELIEDLNRIACAEQQERLRADPARAADAIQSLRFIDSTQLSRYAREGWLTRDEVDLIERFLAFARDRLTPVPAGADPLGFTRSDAGWQAVRSRALELVLALDAFVDIGVPGWGHQHGRRASGR